MEVKNNDIKYEKLREDMVKTQIISRGIRDTDVLNAIRKIPRHLFVEPEKYYSAYGDYPISIGFSQTISQPYIVALMTELLELNHDDKVLEIGTGSGYQTAVLAEIAKEVFTIEFINRLSEKARKVLDSIGYTNIRFKVGNGYDGWPEFSPYNKIIVTAAPNNIPQKLKEQLADRGKMVIPVGNSVFNQSLLKICREGNRFKSEEICGVSFVPMINN
jgi:protein-L-isoaspartate(D-aspartate) O-methyltransferase